MMIGTFDDFRNAVAHGDRAIMNRTMPSRSSATWFDWWSNLGGVSPFNGAAALGRTDSRIEFVSDTEDRWLVETHIGWSNAGAVMLHDRLCHSGLLLRDTTDSQTVNTPALTRYSTGAGVHAALVLDGTGTTESTVTVTYTNQAGTTGRTGTCMIGTSAYGGSGSWCWVRPDPADTGIRSVQTVQLDVVSGTQKFAVVLYRPLVLLNADRNARRRNLIAGEMVGMLPAIDNDACLSAACDAHLYSTTAWATLSLTIGG